MYIRWFVILALCAMLLGVAHGQCLETVPLTGTYVLGGQATGGPNGPFTLTATPSTYSSVGFVASQTFTFGQLTSLFANFQSNSGGSGGGTPRFVVGVKVGVVEQYIDIYLGNSPAFTDTDAVLNSYSGFNVIGNNDTGRYDTSGLVGGSPFTTYSGSATSALTLAGSLQVLHIFFVTDTFRPFRDRNETLFAIGASVLAPCPAGAYQVRYAANVTVATDSLVNIINTGANGGVPAFGPSFGAANGGNICVNVYAIDPDEELISCCSCLVTPNQVVALQVAAGILSNTLTPKTQSSMTIKLVGSAGPTPTPGEAGPSNCNESAATVATTATSNVPVAGYVAFGTTVHPGALGTLAVTESPFLPASLSNSELVSLQARCATILGNGTSYGVCTGCQNGALGAAKR